MFRQSFGQIAAALASTALSFPVQVDHHRGRTRYPKGYKPSRGYSYTGDKGERAAARRLKQAERNARRQAERLAGSYWQRNGHTDVVGVSRRGKPIYATEG